MIVGVSVEKSVAFRGGVQPFANVYYYTGAITEVNATECESLLDQIVALEKNYHSTAITWVRGRVWRADGTKAQNVMIVDKTLSGNGTLQPSTTMDRERAVLVQIRAGVDSRGRPVRLRKWFHVAADAFGGSTVSAGQLANTAQLTSQQRATYAALGDDLKEIGVGLGGATTMALCGPTGRMPTAGASTHPYLEHHQLGDAWRG